MSTETSVTRLLRLENALNALRVEMDGKFETLKAEVERRISNKADATSLALSAIDRRIDQLKADLDSGVQRILEAVGAGDDTGGG